MKIPREDAVKTQRNLLDAAGEVFAEKGYRDATIAEICGRAGTNVAAVNYHFGSKESLYIEAWRGAFLESLKAHPPDGGVRADAPPEERLRGHVIATIRRLSDKNNKEFWFVQREFASPTGLLEEVMREEIQPLRQRTESLVRELLGPKAAKRNVEFCEASIISQCVNPMVVGRQAGDKTPGKGGPLKIQNMEAYAEHVVIFSLAGLQAVRESIESKQMERSKTGKACVKTRDAL